MPAIRYHFQAEMEDGSQIEVTADQRDVARWELQPFGTAGTALTTRIYSAMRYLAWAALARQKLTTLTWDQWDAQCVEVIDTPGVESGDAADPGIPAQSAAS